MKIDAACDRFLRFQRSAKSASEHTLRAYAGDLLAFGQFTHGLGVDTVGRITREAVRAWVSHQSASVGASTISRRLSALRSLFKFLVDIEVIKQFPIIDMRAPKKKKMLPRVLTVDQITKLIESVDGDSEADIRDRAILEVLYSTGARVSEIVGANYGDLDGSREALLVRGKGRKERMCVLGSRARSALERYLSVRSTSPLTARSPIFVNQGRGLSSRTRLTDRSVRRMLEARLDAAGMAGVASPHTLRHSFATHMLEAGANVRQVQEFLGHAGVSTTQQYVHVTPSHLRSAYDRAHPRAKVGEQNPEGPRSPSEP